MQVSVAPVVSEGGPAGDQRAEDPASAPGRQRAAAPDAGEVASLVELHPSSRDGSAPGHRDDGGNRGRMQAEPAEHSLPDGLVAAAEDLVVDSHERVCVLLAGDRNQIYAGGRRRSCSSKAARTEAVSMTASQQPGSMTGNSTAAVRAAA